MATIRESLCEGGLLMGGCYLKGGACLTSFSGGKESLMISYPALMISYPDLGLSGLGREFLNPTVPIPGNQKPTVLVPTSLLFLN